MYYSLNYVLQLYITLTFTIVIYHTVLYFKLFIITIPPTSGIYNSITSFIYKHI